MSKSAVINPGRLLGYARVSTAEQEVDRQRRELSAAGCSMIYVDVMSGASEDRPELAALIADLVEGDTVVVCRLDRLGRRVRGLLELAENWTAQGVHLRSLRERLDTGTPQGRLFFTLTSAYAEFERDVIIDRTKSGQAAARARGVKFGRPKKTSSDPRVITVKSLVNSGISVRQAAKEVSVSESTARRYLRL